MLSSTIRMRRPRLVAEVMGFRDGQEERERRAVTWAVAVRGDRTRELARGIRTRVQAKAVATLFRREAVLEHPAQVVRGDADAAVGDDDRDLIAAAFDLDLELTARALGLERMTGVRDQVDHDLEQLVAVGVERRHVAVVLDEIDVVARERRLAQMECIVDQARELDW